MDDDERWPERPRFDFDFDFDFVFAGEGVGEGEGKGNGEGSGRSFMGEGERENFFRYWGRCWSFVIQLGVLLSAEIAARIR